MLLDLQLFNAEVLDTDIIFSRTWNLKCAKDTAIKDILTDIDVGT